MLSVEKCDNIDLKVKATNQVLFSNDAHQAFFLSASESVNLREGISIGELE